MGILLRTPSNSTTIFIKKSLRPIPQGRGARTLVKDGG